jgi:hypothetical protein
LFYTLLLKGCLFDGWSRWYDALQRAVAKALLALEIIYTGYVKITRSPVG